MLIKIAKLETKLINVQQCYKAVILGIVFSAQQKNNHTLSFFFLEVKILTVQGCKMSVP